MVKAPVEQDRFRVLCNSVPVEQLGTVMAALAKIGVLDVHTELVTDVITFNRRQNHDTSAEVFLQEKWLPDHPTFKAKEVVTFFDLHGRTPGAAYTALRVLVEKKELKKLGEGQYARKDAFLPTSTKKKEAKPKAKKAVVHSKPNSQFALDFAMKNGGQLVRADLKKAMEKAGRNTTGISAMVRELLKHKRIERASEGIYSVKSASPLNGSGEAHA